MVVGEDEGVIVAWNAAAERIFGYTADEVVGRPLTVIVPERFRAAHEEGIARVASGGEPHVIGSTVELAGIHADGHEFPVELSLSTWEEDDRRYFGGIVRDVSERVRLAREVEEARQRSEALVESATDAVVVGDADGYHRGGTRPPSASSATPCDAVLGEPLTVIVPERFREAHEAGIARVASGGAQHVIGSTVALAGLHSDGHEFPVELSCRPGRKTAAASSAGSSATCPSGCAWRARSTRRGERLEAILESATDAVVCADASGRITLWNPAAARMLGYAADQVLGESLTVIVPERFREAHEAGIARVASGGAQHVIGATVELAAVRADGVEIPVELSLSTWTIGDHRFFGGIIRDITARKAVEVELQAMNAELEEKTQQLEGLSGKLAKYLSRNVYDSIFEGRTDVKVESYRKMLTVFFSDIQGFTELTDSMEAEALSQLLNEYLSDMADIATRHGGTVDKFIGDGIMIFFGDPDTRGEKADAIACVEMAMEMRERVRRLQHSWHDRGVARTLHVRMGINTGYCTVGNFGSEDRLDYTIVGGQVNAASRLETAAGPDEILISHSTYGLVKDAIHCEWVGEIKVKGIAYPIRTYRVGAGTADQDLLLIQEERDGFHLSLDPRALDTEDLAAARETLRRALETLDAQAPAVDFDL